MCLAKFIIDLQRKFEAIPAPGAIFYNAIVKKLLSKLESELARNILQRIEKGILIDIGSGTGYLSKEIAKRAPHLKIYGIDLSKKMVEIASGYAKDFENVKFRLADAAKLPFEDDSVDFIVSTGSFHHWRRPIKIFNECYRVLKSNSEGWIYDGCSNPPNEQIYKLIRKYGFLRYLLFTQIQKLHGFPWKEYNTKIKRLLENTKFKKSFQMDFIDGWMRISLKKFS